MAGGSGINKLSNQLPWAYSEILWDNISGKEGKRGLSLVLVVGFTKATLELY